MTPQKNQTLELTIDAFGAQGEGVARVEGMAVFVPGALPGERVLSRIVKVDKRCAFARVERVLLPSPRRVQPTCPYYPRCGGCACQHMDYASQLAFKRDQVAGCMRHIAGLSVPVRDTLGMPSPWRYRNKTALPVAGEAGTPQIGYYAQRSHRVVDVQRCLIASEASDRVNKAVRDWMSAYAVPPYHEETGKGLIRHVMTRVSRAGACMAVLVINGDTLPRESELIERLRASEPSLVSVCLSVNKSAGNVILGDSYRALWGSARLRDTLCGQVFLLSPLSFFQVNPQQTEKLYGAALELCELRGGEEAADLYCGAGTISLLLAGRAKHVTGVEIVPQAIADAKENAHLNKVDNVDFRQGAAEDVLPQLVQNGLRPDVLVLDPPRKGADARVLSAIIACAPKRVVYVSCNPATQARDAKALCEGGYRAEVCQPVDMFCQTAGVENVMLFIKNESNTEE